MPEARCPSKTSTASREAYSLLIDTHVKDPARKTHLLRGIKTVSCRCDSTATSFVERIVEGIFLGIFLCHLLAQKHGLMLGLCLSNELISHDKGLYSNFACLLYSKLIN